MMILLSTSSFASQEISLIANKDITLSQLKKLIETKGTGKTNPFSITIQVLEKDKKYLIPIQKFEEKVLARGGDDVGNGGDTLREQLYRSTSKTIEELVVQYGELYTFSDASSVNLIELSSIISEEKTIIVENIINQTDLFQDIELNYYVLENMIFLKRSYIDSLLKENKDLRQLLLHLLIVANGKSDLNFSKSLELYSTLGLASINKMGKNPVCVFNYSNFTIEDPVYNGVINVSKDPRKIGILVCKESGLSECRIKSYTQRSSRRGSPVSFKVFYEGKKINIERGTNKCAQATNCREIYNTAPLGQIRSSEFIKVENEFTRYCL
jgi:hypothetical protein